MKKISALILLIALISGLSIAPAPTASAADDFTAVNETFLDRVKKDYTPVWSDEFNGDTLDTTKWGFDGQNCRRNSELQVYCDSMDDGNLVFDGENAVIVPKVETRTAADGKTYKYTSCEISTQGKQSWKYGYFEIRAKASCGKNIVPAIWTMGYDYPSGSCVWPKSGEIDIIERKDDKSVYSSLHHAYYGTNTHTSISAGGASFSHKLNEEFHNYWLYWTDKYLIVGCDDQMNNIIDITTPDLAQSYRTYEHWLILNVALGMFSNPVDDSEEDQWKMWIDYARVYQLDNDVLYDNYKAISTTGMKHNGGLDSYNGSVSNIKGKNNLTFTQTDELAPGKYDIYAEVSNKNGVIDTYVNDVKTNEISYVDRGTSIGRQAFVGSVDLQDGSPFDISFRPVTADGVTVKKLIFIKTDETKIAAPVVNKDNCAYVTDFAEAATAEELEAAAAALTQGGTIKLTDNITLNKSISLYYGCTIDLNGYKITASNGKLVIISDKIFIKNGEIFVNSSSVGGFISTKENHYSAEIELDNVNVTIDTASWGTFFTHNFGAIKAACNNSTFTLTERVSTYLISAGKAAYYNCTFDLNGKNAFKISNGSNTSINYINFNCCTINNAKYLFNSENALTGNVKVNLANTAITGLSALSSFNENAAYVFVAQNNVLKNSDGVTAVAADMTGDFTMECMHSFVDASCTEARHCEYCQLTDGEALGHIENVVTTPATCLKKGSVKTTCTRCEKTLSEEIISVLEHNYEKINTVEPSCAQAGYHLWKCSECGTEQQSSYYGDGRVIKPAHTPDTARTTVKAPTCTIGGYTQQYCLVCNKAYKQNLCLSSEHSYGETIVTTPAICGNTGAGSHTCTECDYSESFVIPAPGEHNFVNGVCTVCELSEDENPEGNICYIVETRVKYLTLKQALDAVKTNQTINLYSDAEINYYDAASGSYNNKSIVINMRNHKISVTGSRGIVMYTGGTGYTITLKNGTVTNTAGNGRDGFFWLRDNSKYIFENVAIELIASTTIGQYNSAIVVCHGTNASAEFVNCTITTPASYTNANLWSYTQIPTVTLKNTSITSYVDIFANSNSTVYSGAFSLLGGSSFTAVPTIAENSIKTIDTPTQLVVSEVTECQHSFVNGFCTLCDEPEHYYDITIDGNTVSYANFEQIILPESTVKGFAAYTDGVSYYQAGEKVIVDKSCSFSSVSLSFSMKKGAAMRYNDPCGIRFYSELDTDLIASLESAGAEIKAGTLITLKSIVGENELTLDLNAAVGNVEYNTRDWFTDDTGFKGMVGSIVKIKPENVNKEFVGRGYITVKYKGVTNTIYADYADASIANNSRSVCYVANQVMLNDYATLSEKNKQLVKYYADLYTGDDKY